MPLDEPRQDQSPRQITSSAGGKWAAQFAPDGKSIYYLDSGQIMIRKFPTGDQTQRSEEHTSELQSRPHLVCRLLLEKKKQFTVNVKLGKIKRKSVSSSCYTEDTTFLTTTRPAYSSQIASSMCLKRSSCTATKRSSLT